mmetsp:Transcript_14718/g.30800  ORF Transcript_14718/g.30800 Transcript_14718/m.30800 type:complete len:86 (+) Transcript_14718:180-437(+)
MRVSTSSQVLKLEVYMYASGTLVRAMHARFQLYHLTRSSSIMFERRAKRLLVNSGSSMTMPIRRLESDSAPRIAIAESGCGRVQK